MDTSKLTMELDVHTHTIVSGHAYGTIREMAGAAAETGLKLLGTSEHAPGIPGTCDPIYFRNLNAAPKEYGGVKLAYGSEINILNDGSLSLEDRIIDLLDYRIAGIHDLCYQVGDREANTEATVRAILNPRVDIISHPDDGAIPLDYRRVVEAAKRGHTLLEVNNNALRSKDRRINSEENYREMLAYCKEYGVSIIFSSDAHDPGDVGNFSSIFAFMAQVDFPEELVMNTSVERFWAFIKENRANQ